VSAVKICGAGLLCLVTLLCVRNLRESFAPLLRFAASLLFIGTLIGMISPLVVYGKSIIDKSGISEYGEVIVKALGIAYLTHITSGICRDCGETSIASGVENVGRIEILLLALPLFEEILSLVGVMLSW